MTILLPAEVVATQLSFSLEKSDSDEGQTKGKNKIHRSNNAILLLGKM